MMHPRVSEAKISNKNTKSNQKDVTPILHSKTVVVSPPSMLKGC